MSEGKKLWLVFAALGLVACGQPQNPTLHPEQALYEPLTQAIAAWEPHIQACGRSLSITADDGDFMVRFGKPPTGGDTAADTHIDDLGNGTIIVNPEATDPTLDPDGLVKTLTHELGHVLGADDSNDSRDVMYWQSNGVMLPSEHDIAVVCSH